MGKSIHNKRYQELMTLLRTKRESAGLTQIQLAEKLNLSQTIVSKIETCERRLDIMEFLDMCEVLNISNVDLLNALNKKN